jgi:N-acetyl-anhydromuramyl-L-alanine amidase AmpD
MRFPAVALLSTLALTACATNVTVEDGIASSVTVGLDDDFADAAARHGVPADLLKALSYVETRWQNIESEGHDGPAAYGVMALGAGRLTRAAELASRHEDETATDVFANIDAAAALLADAAARTGVSGTSLESWRPAVAEFAWIGDDDARVDYVRTVYNRLGAGAREVAESGELIADLPAHPEVATYVAGDNGVAGPDYAASEWRQSPNYSSRPSGVSPAMVIIHTCEGAYSGCWGWLRNSASGVSAHYVVKEDGSEITQLVRESAKAWHIAATYKCSLNSNTDCTRNGQSSNNFTIGIEHAGFASQTSFPTGQIEASARLVCDITRDQNIPRDRNHIVGHGQLQPYNRVDPGPNWPWSHYIDRIRTLCGTSPTDPPPTPPPPSAIDIIVDSNNANNNAASARIALTGSWTSASSTPGYYGSGYWYGDTGSTGAASFEFYAPTAGTRTVQAWWTQGTNRSAAAQWVGFNAGGTQVGSAAISQQSSGSQWVTIGTWNFTAGWNRVELRRSGTAGKVVIADAVRIR